MKRVRQVREARRFLSGWKEIASYLGKGVRTVQRYERELGFPVRRPAGKSHAGVIATRAEVDAWVAASPIRKQFVLSSTPLDWETAMENVKKGVQTMGALRAQMQALRGELQASVSDLRRSIQGIRLDMRGDQLSNVRGHYRVSFETQELNENDFQLQRKVI
jgi:predicted DNA-binding transcriptional regulator AlpA